MTQDMWECLVIVSGTIQMDGDLHLTLDKSHTILYQLIKFKLFNWCLFEPSNFDNARHGHYGGHRPKNKHSKLCSRILFIIRKIFHSIYVVARINWLKIEWSIQLNVPSLNVPCDLSVYLCIYRWMATALKTLTNYTQFHRGNSSTRPRPSEKNKTANYNFFIDFVVFTFLFLWQWTVKGESQWRCCPLTYVTIKRLTSEEKTWCRCSQRRWNKQSMEVVTTMTISFR